MPHISIKMYPGKTEAQKTALAEQIVKDFISIAGSREESISVSIEEVSPEQWAETVYKPEILEGSGTLYKKPGYNPFK